MTPTKKRPVHLDLLAIRMPVAAVVSIAHRLSGLLLVVSIPFAIYLLGLSLESEAGFERAGALLGQPVVKGLLFFIGWGLVHHLLAGLRFLAIDLDLGVERRTARRTAWGVILGAAFFAVVLGTLL